MLCYFLLAAQLKISCTFYFVRDLDIGMRYLPSRIQHTPLEIQIFVKRKCNFLPGGGGGGGALEIFQVLYIFSDPPAL